MRPLALIVLSGITVFTTGIHAQNLAEHGAAAAGATIGTAAGKPMSNAITKIFGETGQQAKSAAATAVTRTVPKSTAAPVETTGTVATGPAPGGSGVGSGPIGGGGDGSVAPRRAARSSRIQHEVAVSAPTAEPFIAVPAPVVVPPPKEPTLEELASVRLGATQQDLKELLGLPASHVIIPDDDGHLRESCQYWAKGMQLGTVRLDNGYVVKVEYRRAN